MTKKAYTRNQLVLELETKHTHTFNIDLSVAFSWILVHKINVSELVLNFGKIDEKMSCVWCIFEQIDKENWRQKFAFHCGGLCVCVWKINGKIMQNGVLCVHNRHLVTFDSKL